MVGKIPVSDIVKQHQAGLAMIALVHIRGTRKYEPYSWLNNPNASNSTVKENIDALWRHFTAHSMGRPVDPEGLPHIFHMACRAGMLVSTYYRSINPIKPLYEDVRGLEKVDETTFGWMLTPEEIFSLSKFHYNDLKGMNTEEFTPWLMNALVDLSLSDQKDYFPPTDWKILSKVMGIDILFFRILQFCKLQWENRTPWIDQFTDVTPAERKYIRKYIR